MSCESPIKVNLSLGDHDRGKGVSDSSTLGYNRAIRSTCRLVSEFEDEEVELLPAAMLVIAVRAYPLRHRDAQSNVGPLKPQVAQARDFSLNPISFFIRFFRIFKESFKEQIWTNSLLYGKFSYSALIYPLPWSKKRKHIN